MALILGLIVAVIVVAGFIAYWIFMVALFVIGAVLLFWYFVFMSLFPDNIMIILPGTIFATGLCFWAAIALDSARKKARLKNVD